MWVKSRHNVLRYAVMPCHAVGGRCRPSFDFFTGLNQTGPTLGRRLLAKPANGPRVGQQGAHLAPADGRIPSVRIDYL